MLTNFQATAGNRAVAELVDETRRRGVDNGSSRVLPSVSDLLDESIEIADLAARLLSVPSGLASVVVNALGGGRRQQLALHLHESGMLPSFIGRLARGSADSAETLMRELPPPTCLEVLERMWQGEAFPFLLRTIERAWPVNFGMFLEGTFGATLGLPAADGTATLYLYRKSPREFVIRRRLDALLGVHSQWGESGQVRAPLIGQVGADAGAEGKLGLKAITTEEFTFDVRRDHALTAGLITWLSTVFGPAATPMAMMPTALLEVVVPSMRGINPEHYRTLYKVEMQGVAEGDAQARVGLPGTAPPREGDRSGLERQSWLEKLLFRHGMLGRLMGMAGWSVEVKTPEGMRADPTTGFPIPNAVEIEVGAEAGGLLEIDAGLLTNLGLAGLGDVDLERIYELKLKWKVANFTPETELSERPHFISVIRKRGEIDEPTHAGRAEEAEVEFATGEGGQARGLSSVAYKRRLDVGNLNFVRDKLALRRMLDKTLPFEGWRNFGLRAGGYVDLDITMPSERFEQLARMVGPVVLPAIEEAFARGRVSPALRPKLDEVLATLAQDVKKLTSHLEIGISVGAAASVGAGATGRLEGMASGVVTADIDLKPLLIGEGRPGPDLRNVLFAPPGQGEQIDLPPESEDRQGFLDTLRALVPDDVEDLWRIHM